MKTLKYIIGTLAYYKTINIFKIIRSERKAFQEFKEDMEKINDVRG